MSPPGTCGTRQTRGTWQVKVEGSARFPVLTRKQKSNKRQNRSCVLVQCGWQALGHQRTQVHRWEVLAGFLGGPVLLVEEELCPCFPGGASGIEPACQCRRQRRPRFHPWVGKIPWRRAWQPTPAFLPGEFHGQKNLAGYSPWGLKELDMTEAT